MSQPFIKAVLEDFDFSVLEKSEFKEDSVREELIAPFLRSLGYKPHGDFKVIRSQSLEHPSVMIGSTSRKISLIPDYTLYVKRKPAFVLDAKAPNQEITKGKNVEQVYSYAIHPEIRTSLYVLFNGKELSIFHIYCMEPVFYCYVHELMENWDSIKKILSPYSVLEYRPKPYLYKDYGLHLEKLGYRDKDVYFYDMPVDNIARLDSENFSITNNLLSEDIEFCVTFDFAHENLLMLLINVPEAKKYEITCALNQYPFKTNLASPFHVGVKANLDQPRKTRDEIIFPLKVINFF